MNIQDHFTYDEIAGALQKIGSRTAFGQTQTPGIYPVVYPDTNETAAVALSLDREANKMTGGNIAYFNMSEAKAAFFEAYSKGNMCEAMAQLTALGEIVVRLMVGIARWEKHIRECRHYGARRCECKFFGKEDHICDCKRLCAYGECPIMEDRQCHGVKK